ncbi:hypothetical protein E3U43_005760 [Larimichthys crocea]|uniref:Uncharacterized protein n=1 Tax=Larimichthys crocea TaxID=215358 RepID=A0ACD3QM82_LARCR|nr:hypothetical protein E3U43_005760 [Larimichthys crocea]
MRTHCRLQLTILLLTPPRSQRLSLHPATAPVPAREPVSPLRVESARALHPQHYHQQQPQQNHHHHQGHHSQQRDTARPPQQTYAKPQQYAHVPPKSAPTASTSCINSNRPNINNSISSFQLSSRVHKFSHCRLHSSRLSRRFADLFLSFRHLWTSQDRVTPKT